MTTDDKPDSNLYALERTHMAAERTFFAVLRTGLAIAGAGTVVVAILGESRFHYLVLSSLNSTCCSNRLEGGTHP